jgi:hypothetical protein
VLGISYGLNKGIEEAEDSADLELEDAAESAGLEGIDLEIKYSLIV